uniref:Enhancer of split m7 protein n=1 Tax=Caligus clemensi TaxID=344056 RepID=C1C090_CALCM|nr:Enhancer of split m7 protein [Caligus clemensi]
MSILYKDSNNTTSRTHQYRKVMKPLLERKRRARINKSLDEIKDLLRDTLAAESGGDSSLNKLEKADILELTVKHLREIVPPKAPPQQSPFLLDPYISGYSACATHTSQFLHSLPGQTQFTSDLLSHLSTQLRPLCQVQSPMPPAPQKVQRSPPPSGSLTPPPDQQIKTEFVWRPF